jgi:hypothetical protein
LANLATVRRLTGSARLLGGYDFVVKTSPSGDVELIVLGAAAAANLAQGMPPPTSG